jgi:hypothetical protein
MIRRWSPLRSWLAAPLDRDVHSPAKKWEVTRSRIRPVFPARRFLLSARCRSAGYSATEAQRCATWSLNRSRSHTCLLLIDQSTIPPLTSSRGPLPADQAGSPTAAGRPMKPVQRKSRLTLLLICWIRTQFIAERPQEIARIPPQVKNLR